MTLSRLLDTKSIVTIITFAIIGFVFQACTTQNSTKHDRVVNQPKRGDSEYQYSPSGCLFEVTFPEEPDEKNVKRSSNPHNISMEIAILAVKDDSTFISANFELYDRPFDPASQSTLLSMLKKEAALKGIPDAEVQYIQDSLGACYTLQGSKVVEEVNTMYSDRWYFKGNNLFCVSVVCPVDKYPTQTAKDFFASVKLATK